MAEGIRRLHSKGCPSKEGGRCRCNAGFEASVWSNRDRKKIRKTFAREAEAKSWRSDALTALARGGLRATKPITIRQAWEAWHEGAKAGTVTNRSGDPYKPSALRSYERAMRLRVLPEFGAVRLADLRRPDLQDFADGLLSEGLNPSTIKVTLLPLRAVMRRAVGRGDLAVNPCDGLELAAVRGGRERIASPTEAEALIAAVPERDRAVWATAMYGGLRRGELQALRAEDLDLANGVIRLERGWDEREGAIDLKSRAGRRRVPITAVLRDFLTDTAVLRDFLTEHRVRVERKDTELAFGRTDSAPFDAKALQARADKAWKKAKLERITLHECRHTFASLMIAASVNAKALSTYMGHSSVSITLDRYGHLMPGSEAEAAGLLDTYLTAERKRQEEAARTAGNGKLHLSRT
jgi:integrase